MVDTDSDKWWLIRIGYKCTDKNILLEPGALISVGRSQQSTILINSSFCSRNHCVFSIKGDILRLRDSNSINGTYINEQQIKNEEKILHDNDLIGFGVNVPLTECGDHNPEYYVYRVQKNIETVVLLDDDEDNDEDPTPHDNDKNDENVICIDDDEDENDLQMSQYYYENQQKEQSEFDAYEFIKKEVITDENESFDNIDFHHCEIDENDNECQNEQQKIIDNDWASQLILINSSDDDDDDNAAAAQSKSYQNHQIKQEILDQNDDNLNVNLDAEFSNDNALSNQAPNENDSITLTQQLTKIIGNPDVEQFNAVIPPPLDEKSNLLESKKRKLPLDECDQELSRKRKYDDDKNINTHEKPYMVSIPKSAAINENENSHNSNNIIIDKTERIISKDKGLSTTSSSSNCHTNNKIDINKTERIVSKDKESLTITVPSSTTTSSSSSSHKSGHSSGHHRVIEFIEPQPLKTKRRSSKKEPSSSKTKEKHHKSRSSSSSSKSSTHHHRHHKHEEHSSSKKDTEKRIETTKRLANVKTKVTWNNRGSFLVEDTKLSKSKQQSPSTSKSLSSSSSSTNLHTIDAIAASLDTNLELVVEKNIEEIINPKIVEASSSLPSTIVKPSHQPDNNLSTFKCPKLNDPRTTSSNYRNLANGSTTLKAVSFGRQPIERNNLQLSAVASTSNNGGLYQHNNYSNSIYSLKLDSATYHLLVKMTKFDPSWLDTEKTPPINGHDEILYPMTDDYASIQHFQKVLIPLMKLEFWEKVKFEYSKNKTAENYDIKIKHFKHNQGVGNKNFKSVFECEAQKTANIKVWDLAIVSYGSQNNVHEFFAFISDLTYNRDNCFFTMEAASISANKSLNTNTKNVKIFSFAQLKSEFLTFNVIYTLKDSPLLDNILHPLLNSIKSVDCVPIQKYVGYDSLDESQMACLTSIYRRCLQSDDSNISLIDGPPGTGKSRVIYNLILQLVFGKEVLKKKRILICAQSNTAVDVITKKLIKIRLKIQNHSSRFKLVRFGVTDRMDPMVRAYTVDAFAKNSQSEKIKLLERERGMLLLNIKALQLKASKNFHDADKLENYQNRLKNIENDLRQTCRANDSMTCHILRGAHIIATTLSSCNNLVRYIGSVDVCIIDEATQCCEPLSLIPLQFGVSSLVLVGDTRQLPATVLSQKCKNSNFSQSLFARIQHSFDTNSKNNPVLRLNRQYRMHPEICNWPNEYFYSNRLDTDASACDALFPFVPYKVFSLDYDQNSDCDLSNNKEATFLIGLLNSMAKHTNMTKSDYSYSVLTPYTKQQELLQSKIRDNDILKGIPIKTIDASQGQEDDIVLISIGRTSGSGFLVSPQRVNVAMTRAKKCLILFCNFRAVKNIRVWDLLLENAKKRKCLIHIHNEPQNYDLILSRLLKPI